MHLHVTGLQVRSYAFDLAKFSFYYRKGQRCAHTESIFVRVTVLVIEALKVPYPKFDK